MTDKSYLGDGVYIVFDGHGVDLTTENGISITNRIYLEPEVIVGLLRALGEHYDRGKLCEAIGVDVEPLPSCPACGETDLVRIQERPDKPPTHAVCRACRHSWEIEPGALETVEAESLTIGNEVQLSNKACPRYYSTAYFERGQRVGEVVPSKQCRCPDGRCWYDEQMKRRIAGKLALSPEFWLEHEALADQLKTDVDEPI